MLFWQAKTAAAQMVEKGMSQRVQVTKQTGSNNDLLIISFPTQGWYLVSLPVAVQDSAVNTLFPMADTMVTWQNSQYVGVDTMTSGRGYWLFIPEPSVAFIEGTPINRFGGHFTPGWQLIGSVIDTVNFSNPNDTPDGSILLPAFRWNGDDQRYNPPTFRISEAFGHWIAVQQECDLTIEHDGSNFANSNTAKQIVASDWRIPLTITLEGQAGQDQLSFGASFAATDSLNPGVDLLNPPAPPNVFDAFFQIDHLLFPNLTEDFRADTVTTATWNLIISETNGASGTITWDASGFPIPDSRLEIRQGNTVLADMLSVSTLNYTGDQNLTISLSPRRDTLSCELKILTPKADEIVCSDSVLVLAQTTLTGGVPPIVSTCTVNGFPAKVSGNTLSATIPLVIGKNTVKVACTFRDAIGDSAVCIDSVTVVGCQPPECNVSIVEPKNNAIICQESIQVTAVKRVSGGVPPISSTCLINGIPAVVNGDTLRASIPIQSGKNIIKLICTSIDSIGNRADCVDSVQIVGCKPLTCSITIVSPSNGASTLDDSIRVKAVSSAAGGVPPLRRSFDINGFPAIVDRDTIRATVPIIFGNNKIKATCTVVDSIGNKAVCTDSIQVNGRKQPTCQVVITSPKESEILCGKTVKVTGITRLNNVLPPFTIKCEVNGVATSIADSIFTATVPLNLGNNILIAVCTIIDGRGTATICSDTIRVTGIADNTSPTCNFTPGYKSVTGTFFDNESGIAKIEALFLFNARLTVDPFKPGDKQVKFRLDDLGLESYLGFDIKITDLCGNSHVCDPVMSYLSADQNNRQYKFKFRSVDRYLVLTNRGLSAIRVDLNGHQFGLYAKSSRGVRLLNAYHIPDEGSITIDLQPYLREGDNTMQVEIEGAPGTNADFLLIDEAHHLDHTLELKPLPVEFQLSQNYPNPFNPSTTIHFSIPARMTDGNLVQLRIYNTLGELVRTLVNEKMFPGQYAVTWDGKNDSSREIVSGVYIYQFVTREFRKTKRMLFLK